MMRVAVGLQLRARARPLVLLVHARDAAQERERRGGEAGLRERRRLADQDLGARIGGLDGGVALRVELAVERRTGRERAEPGLVVRLVPDAVAVDAALEVLGGERGELAELGCVRLVPRALWDEALRIGPTRGRSGERDVDPDTIRGGLVDQRVVAGEAVVDDGRLVTRVELRLGH